MKKSQSDVSIATYGKWASYWAAQVGKSKTGSEDIGLRVGKGQVAEIESACKKVQSLQWPTKSNVRAISHCVLPPESPQPPLAGPGKCQACANLKNLALAVVSAWNPHHRISL